MCVHKTPCRSLFISFVSFLFNKRHVSVPTRTSIRAIGAIRVKKNIRVICVIRVQKKLVFKIRVRSVCQINIRVIRIIRVQKQ